MAPVREPRCFAQVISLTEVTEHADSCSAILNPIGFTGTYRGMIEKLDHLQSLGINCLELLPVQEFNEMEYYQASLSRPCPG